MLTDFTVEEFLKEAFNAHPVECNLVFLQFCRDAMGILLVYDVTQKETFNNIQSWLDGIDVRPIFLKIQFSLIKKAAEV